MFFTKVSKGIDPLVGIVMSLVKSADPACASNMSNGVYR